MPDAPMPASKVSVRSTRTIPDSARQLPTDPKTLTFSILSLDQEMDATKVAEAAGGGNARLTVELTKRSVIMVDGKAIDWAGTDPEWLDRASPKVRQLAFKGFILLNRPTDDEDLSFLESEVVSSG
jgi:hypothetical protein